MDEPVTPPFEAATAPDSSGNGAAGTSAAGSSGGHGLVARNALWYASADLVGKIASFVLVVVVARGLGTRQYGYFIFGLSLVPLFMTLATWGVDLATVRQLARDPERLSEVYASGLVLRAGNAFVALLLAIAIAPALVGPADAFLAVVIVGAAVFLDELSRFHTGVFVAFERMRTNALILLVNRFLSTALAVVVVAAGGGLIAICVTYFVGSLGALVSAVVAVRVCFPAVRWRDADRARMRALFKDGVPYGLAGFLRMGVFRIDTVLLELIKGPIQVAFYGVAYRFFEPLLFATWSLASAALPRVSRGGGSRESARVFELVAALALAFYLPVALGTPFTARWLVTLLFSDRYQSATAAVVWLTATALAYAIANLASVSAMGVGKRSQVTWVAACTLVVNVALNIVIIPRYGFTGAAAVSFFTEALDVILAVAVLRSACPIRWSRPMTAVVVAAGGMGLVLLLFGLDGPAALAVGALVYLGLLGLSARVLVPDEFGAAVRRWMPGRSRVGS